MDHGHTQIMWKVQQICNIPGINMVHIIAVPYDRSAGPWLRDELFSRHETQPPDLLSSYWYIYNDASKYLWKPRENVSSVLVHELQARGLRVVLADTRHNLCQTRYVYNKASTSSWKPRETISSVYAHAHVRARAQPLVSTRCTTRSAKQLTANVH